MDLFYHIFYPVSLAFVNKHYTTLDNSYLLFVSKEERYIKIIINSSSMIPIYDKSSIKSKCLYEKSFKIFIFKRDDSMDLTTYL